MCELSGPYLLNQGPRKFVFMDSFPENLLVATFSLVLSDLLSHLVFLFTFGKMTKLSFLLGAQLPV